MTSSVQVLRGGALNAAISNAVVRLLREHVGKGPNKARTIHNEKIVLCVLENTMTKAEQTLATNGKQDFALGMRHAVQHTMEQELTAAVEALTPEKVVAFMSANHVDPDLAAEVFVLDESVGGSGGDGAGRAERWLDDGVELTSVAVARPRPLAG